jgi:hypothetical protein
VRGKEVYSMYLKVQKMQLRGRQGERERGDRDLQCCSTVFDAPIAPSCSVTYGLLSCFLLQVVSREQNIMGIALIVLSQVT